MKTIGDFPGDIAEKVKQAVAIGRRMAINDAMIVILREELRAIGSDDVFNAERVKVALANLKEEES